jgi:hypothetical protein
MCQIKLDDPRFSLSKLLWHSVGIQLIQLETGEFLTFTDIQSNISKASGCGSGGRALGSGPRGRKFKSCHSDHFYEVRLAPLFSIFCPFFV